MLGWWQEALMAGGMAHWVLLGSSTCKQHFRPPALAVS